ncbi:MAG: alpha/beta hydrolase [Verrucomicrobia bacterium]|nr:alpha/beta hydrolase [Verrucomicrobiota bacterium]
MDFEVLTCGNQQGDQLALFLHGFPECAYQWRHQMERLAELGYKCWAPNQRGYGKSYCPSEVSEYHPNLLMDDVARFVKAANCKTVTLITHDWGGVVAWNYAICQKGPLDRLVIMNAPHPFIAQREMKKWNQIRRAWFMLFFQLPSLPEFLLSRNGGAGVVQMLKMGFYRKERLKPDDIEVYRSNALRPNGLKGMINWYRAYFQNLSSLRLELKKHPKLQVPTLLIWGERDVALGKGMSEGTEKYVEQLTVKYLSESGHFVAEEAPDEVNQILTDWLSKRVIFTKKVG